MTESEGISRRQVLTIAAGAAGSSIAGAATIIGTSTQAQAQAAKVSQKIVKYQDTPKGEQRCDNCELFEAPSSCKNVDGTIAPQGWCVVYRKKQA
jgi:High potential iron-sulfur protein